MKHVQRNSEHVQTKLILILILIFFCGFEIRDPKVLNDNLKGKVITGGNELKENVLPNFTKINNNSNSNGMTKVTDDFRVAHEFLCLMKPFHLF